MGVRSGLRRIFHWLEAFTAERRRGDFFGEGFRIGPTNCLDILYALAVKQPVWISIRRNLWTFVSACFWSPSKYGKAKTTIRTCVSLSQALPQFLRRGWCS